MLPNLSNYAYNIDEHVCYRAQIDILVYISSIATVDVKHCNDANRALIRRRGYSHACRSAHTKNFWGGEVQAI